MTYDIVRKNFLKKLWNANMVKNAVIKEVITQEEFVSIMREGVEAGIITAEQFATLTGETY